MFVAAYEVVAGLKLLSTEPRAIILPFVFDEAQVSEFYFSWMIPNRVY